MRLLNAFRSFENLSEIEFYSFGKIGYLILQKFWKCIGIFYNDQQSCWVIRNIYIMSGFHVASAAYFG